MGRVIDILTRATGGADGPKDWPRDCIEHDGALPLAPGAARMTVAEYNAWIASPEMVEAHRVWRAANPPPPPPPEPLAPLSRLAFISLIEDGLGLGYDTLPALIDQHVTDPALARRVKRALAHGVEFDPEAEPIEGVGAIRWLAARLGVTPELFVALWRAAGG